MSEFSKTQELPWRFKAYNEILAIKPSLQAAANSKWEEWFGADKEYLQRESMEINGKHSIKGLDILDGHEIGVSDFRYDHEDNGIIELGIYDFDDDKYYSTFFGVEMPPTLVEQDVVDPSKLTGEMLQEIEDKQFLSDSDCEQLVGLLLSDVDGATPFQPYN